MAISRQGKGMTRREAAGLGGALGGALVGSALAGGVSPAAAQDGSGSGLAAGGRVPVADRLEILELIALYAWAYDCADPAMLKETFTADGELYVWGSLMASAATGFEEMIAHSMEMKAGKGWQHCADHHVFREYDANSCKVYSYYTMFEADADGGSPVGRAMGHYASICVRTGDGWRFARRDVTRWNGEMPFAPGMAG